MTENAVRPCEGLRIVSMAEQYPGPLCTQILTDLGADVIQVERPGSGDPARAFPGLYTALNRGKRSLALDIRHEADRVRLKALVAAADVFLEGFRPGRLAQQGLGAADLMALNPALIHCSISGYGQTGPALDRPCHDLSILGMAGAAGEGEEGGMALVGDTLAGLNAAIAILAALRQRDRTGKGATLDVAMSDAAGAMMAPVLALAEEGYPPPQAEPGYGVFACADRRALTLSIAHEDRFWDQLCAELDMPDAAGLTRPEQIAAHGDLKARIAAAIAARPRMHWAARFDDLGLPWGPCNPPADVPADAHMAARGLFDRLRRDDGAEQWVAGLPFLIDDRRPSSSGQPPALGVDDDAGFDETLKEKKETRT